MEKIQQQRRWRREDLAPDDGGVEKIQYQMTMVWRKFHIR
jgi:hypothetical protein